MGRTLYIINPEASGGQGKRTWDRFVSNWSGMIESEDVIISRHPGHATQIARSASGYDTIATVGGDGTANEIINGIMELEGARPVMAIIPAGTGNDIARTLGLFPLEAAFNAFRSGNEKHFDSIGPMP